MCGPLVVPIIMGVTAVLGAGAAVYSKNQSKHALEDQMKLQQEQTDQGAQAQTDDRQKAAREQRAAARAASAESGSVGNSTDAILNDLMMQSGRDVSRIEKNRENGQLETQQQARSRTAEINGNLVTGLAGSAQAGASAYMAGAGTKTYSLSEMNKMHMAAYLDQTITGYNKDLSRFTISGG
jgi:hypothetical protein